jgi:hypothetical protein
MSTVNAGNLTISDWKKRQDPDGKVARIIEMLEQRNEILDDMVFIMGNLETGHRTTIRTGLPSVAWRLINQGIQPSKSRSAQVDEQCGMLEAFSEVDVDLAKLNGDVEAFRLSESVAFVEAMNIEMASTLIYGNAGVDPEEFTGIAIRYSDLSAANAQNILDAGGTQSDNTSIFLVGWGDQSAAGIFPKGSQVGIFHEDLGIETVENAGGVQGAKMRAYREHFQWKCGFCLKDWRYVVRIANIDVSNLVAMSSAADLANFMIKAIHRLPHKKMCKPVFYMNRTVYEFLDIQRRDDVQVGGQLNYKEVDGKDVGHFRGIPCKIVDAILETEARVV